MTMAVIVRKKHIHPTDEKNPLYTVGWPIGQARADNALNVSVDNVIGKIHPTDLRIQCIPSRGHIIPETINNKSTLVRKN